MQNTKPRIEFVDLAKGICIILVIAHHLVEMSPIYKFASCFHVPVFFCLSGLFFKPSGNVSEFFHKKLNMILIPFVGWYLIGFVINRVGHMMYDDLAERVMHIEDVFTHTYFFDIPLWFLLTLFWMNVLMTLIYRATSNRYVITGVVIGLMSVGWAMSRASVFNFMHMASALSCLPFFYLGCLLKSTPLMRADISRPKVFAAAATALTVGCLAAFVPDRMPRMSYCYNYLWHDSAPLIYLCTISLVIGVILLCKGIGRVPVLVWFGRYSLIVLVTHNILGDIGSKLLYEYAGGTLSLTARSYINFTVVTMLMFAVIPLCRRYLPHLSAQRQLPISTWLTRPAGRATT